MKIPPTPPAPPRFLTDEKGLGIKVIVRHVLCGEVKEKTLHCYFLFSYTVTTSVIPYTYETTLITIQYPAKINNTVASSSEVNIYNINSVLVLQCSVTRNDFRKREKNITRMM